MTVTDLIKYLEDWAPPGVAWERDNVGLQIGSGAEKIKNLMLCLELTEKVLKEALQKKCNFIFTHHPLIFNPIKRLDTEKDSKARLIETIIKNNINVYSAHTNLDFTKDGVSFELARVLKLKNVKFLENEENNQLKIAVFVPLNHLEKISEAMFEAGAGIIGEYNNCSFRSTGLGTFKGSSKSNPKIGKRETFEMVEEVRIESVVDSWKLKKVITAIIKTHPYEEPAYDVYPLKNKNVTYGAGAIGELELEMTEKNFFSHVSRFLKIKNFKYSDGKGKKIKRVALCGGAGSEMLSIAISKGADVFITADIKYHTFQDAGDRILLIDAGHYETEIFSLNAVEKKIKKFFENELKDEIKIFHYSGSTNPARFYKQ
jgi:dinuclear metal center YbgI/SA1388 family protein